MDNATNFPDGLEKGFAINHLGHFLLTNLLLDCLQQAGTSEFCARVVVVASNSHFGAHLNFDEFPLTKSTFSSWRDFMQFKSRSYKESKLCNVLFSNEFNRRMVEDNLLIRSNSLHPGSMINTGIAGKDGSWGKYLMLGLSPFTKTLQQATATSIYCAMSPDLEGVGGKYFNNCKECAPSTSAGNIEMALRLWEVSEQLCKQVLEKE